MTCPSSPRLRNRLDLDLWDLLEQDSGPRLALLTAKELTTAKLLLQVLASGDGVGHEQALALAGRISRRLPEMSNAKQPAGRIGGPYEQKPKSTAARA